MINTNFPHGPVAATPSAEVQVMSSDRTRWMTRGLPLLVLLAGAFGPGCGDPAMIAAVPAAGTVSYKGKPVESGSIQFVPATGRSASGTITNGQFTLTTYEDGDGAVPGQHKVGVMATKDMPAKGGGEAEQVYVIPQEFSMPDLSGVTVDVPAEGKKDIAIDIK